MYFKKKIAPTKTSDGTYRVRWTINGKRSSKHFKKKVEANLFCRNLNNGIFPDEKKAKVKEKVKTKKVMTFKDLAKIYMEKHVNVKLTASTKRNYNSYLLHHIYPVLSNINIEDLHITDLDTLCAEIATKERQKGARDRTGTYVKKYGPVQKVKLSPKMQREIICLVFAITNYGISRDYLKLNPFNKFKLPKIKAKKREYLSGGEVKKFLAWCDAGGYYESKVCGGKYTKKKRPTLTLKTTNIERDTDIFRLALHTGARENEIIALRRKAIDFQNRQLSIHSIFDMSAKEFVDRTKGGNVRRIELDDTAYNVLLKYKNLKPNELVFDIKSRPLWQQAFYVYCNRAGIKVVNFHALRHTFATAMAKVVPTPILQEILGHEDIATTMNYVHTSQADIKGYRNILNSIYETSSDLKKTVS